MKKSIVGLVVIGILVSCQAQKQSIETPADADSRVITDAAPGKKWVPNTDWGHWRLGHRTESDFLESNKFTVTFAPGSPEFERVDRAVFDSITANSMEIIDDFHDRGYIVLRYMTSSVHGTSPTSADQPEDHQLDLYKFFQGDSWSEYEDFLGPKPPAAQDPSTWIMRRSDGSFPFYRYAPYGQQTTGRFEAWGCPNNPNYRNLMSAKIRAQAATGIDGVYMDWTQIAGETCFCEHCIGGFREYLHEHLPPASGRFKYKISDYALVTPPHSHDDPFWMEWVEFRAHTLAGFHRFLRHEARTVNPAFMISGNVYGGFGYGPIAYDAAGHMELFGREGGHDFLYSEIQEYLDTAPHLPESGKRITNSPALKYLSAASRGKPVIVYATEITEPIFPEPTEKALNAMALINIAESVANQAIFREKRLTPAWATKMYNFMADNSESLVGAQLNGSVAVVASIHQYIADRQSFAFSASRVLSDVGIGHIFIVEDQILELDLSQFKVIILPQLQLLSEAQQQRLVEYHKNGGVLIQIGDNGIYDRNNVPISSPLLAGLDGTIIELPDTENGFLIPSSLSGEYTTFGPTLSDRFADIPEGYTRGRIDEALYKVLQDAARQAESKHPAVSKRISAHPHVEFSTMLNQQSRKLLVHLVNYDVSITGDIKPAEKIQLRIEIPEGYQSKAVRYSSDNERFQSLEVKRGGGAITLELDKLDIYGLVIIDME